jgi:hypothetical protein
MGFGSIFNFSWYFLKKLSIIIFLLTWIWSSKNWYRLSIVIPIFIYSYQLIEIFYDIQAIEAYGNSKVFPLLVPFVLAIIVMSRVVLWKSKIMDYIQIFESQIEKEISEISSKDK